jgi:DNA polymerase III delta prime subunit
VNIQEAKEELKRTVLAYTAKTGAGTYRIPPMRQRPVLLMGPPGVGKTAIMAQIAGEMGIGLVSYTMTHHTRQSALGLPVIERREFLGETHPVTEYTMSEIIAAVYRQIETGGFREGFLFMDEINCVSETLMPALLGFLQYKVFGGHRLPEGWIIVAAGNPAAYNHNAREFDTVTLDRLKVIDIEADFGVWKVYARRRGIHPLILSYLTLKPENLYAVLAGPGGRHFVTPRGWEDLSEMILSFEALDLAAEGALFRQYLQHDEIAGDFALFFDLNRSLRGKYRIDEIPAAPRILPELKDARFDERLCVLQFLLHRLGVLAGEWADHDGALRSLDYFAGGLPRVGFVEAAGERLGAREKARGVKKSLGLLESREEAAEILLSRRIRACLTRLQAEKPADPPARFRELAGLSAPEADGPAEALEGAVRNCFSFVKGTFGKSQELVIFLTELRALPEAARFLEKRLPEIREEARSLLDFAGREEELRGKLN